MGRMHNGKETLISFGQIAVGLAAKPVAPKAPLGALLLSATAIDALSGLFAIAGMELTDAAGNSSIPWSLLIISGFMVIVGVRLLKQRGAPLARRIGRTWKNQDVYPIFVLRRHNVQDSDCLRHLDRGHAHGG